MRGLGLLHPLEQNAIALLRVLRRAWKRCRRRSRERRCRRRSARLEASPPRVRAGEGGRARSATRRPSGGFRSGAAGAPTAPAAENDIEQKRSSPPKRLGCGCAQRPELRQSTESEGGSLASRRLVRCPTSASARVDHHGVERSVIPLLVVGRERQMRLRARGRPGIEVHPGRLADQPRPRPQGPSAARWSGPPRTRQTRESRRRARRDRARRRGRVPHARRSRAAVTMDGEPHDDPSSLVSSGRSLWIGAADADCHRGLVMAYTIGVHHVRRPCPQPRSSHA